MADLTPWDEQGLRALVGKLRDDESCNAVADLAADAIDHLLTREAEVRGEERERCARIAEEMACPDGRSATALNAGYQHACREITAAIRDGAPGGDGWSDISGLAQAMAEGENVVVGWWFVHKLLGTSWETDTDPLNPNATHFMIMPAPPAIRGDGMGEG